VALAPGTKLGPYEISAAIGAGGMGEVYSARDTRLDRSVAIKILPAHLSASTEAKQRFEREARSISSLSHPNICQIFDVGNQGGIDFIVLELLQGETLAERLKHGPLPTELVLKLGIDICEGLEKAHRCGIVHRDLKPANIMLTKSGAKLMDFGLAKGSSVPAPAASAAAVSLTTTLSAPPTPSSGTAITRANVIVGTPQYMAPEQLEGTEADSRADVFALGSVLYEMATGKRAFPGTSPVSVMAAVIGSNPEPISASQKMSPPALDRLIHNCLAKNPDDRWQTAHDVKLQLQWIAEGGSLAGIPAPVSTRRRLSQTFAWSAAALSLLLALAMTSAFWRHSPPPTPSLRAALLPPKANTFRRFDFAISPDGTRIAFVADSPGTPSGSLWVRPLNSVVAEQIPGTDDANSPFWSPDGKSIAFFTSHKLKRVAARGGPVTTLADAEDSRGGTWSASGTIVFARTSLDDGLYQVADMGGTISPATVVDKNGKEATHRAPFFLPDGQHLLYFAASEASIFGADPADGVSGVYLLDLKSKKHTRLLRTHSAAQYANGFLFYLEQGNLLAQLFDPSTLKLSGTAVPFAEEVASGGVGLGAFSVSARGLLAYQTGGPVLSQLLWYKRDGTEAGRVGDPGVFSVLSISPDGKQVATSRGDAAGAARDIWLYDLATGTPTRFTFDAKQAASPLWTRDGSRVIFQNAQMGGYIYSKLSTGGGAPDVVEHCTGMVAPTDVTPDGKSLLYLDFSGGEGARLMIHPTEAGKADYPLLQENFDQGEAHFSPDGHWLAYVSEETGEHELYLMPFPSQTGKWQVSAAGGNQPRWRKDGREIYYIAPDGKMMAASVELSANNAKVSAPVALFQTRIVNVSHAYTQYDVTGDGQRFLINSRFDPGAEPIFVYANWPADVHGNDAH
jgi:serine/threonine protein kinase